MRSAEIPKSDAELALANIREALP